MSKRKRKKHRRPQAPQGVPIAGRPGTTPTLGGDGTMLTAARVVCLVGLLALLFLSPTIRYLWHSGLGSENSFFPWACVEILAIGVAAFWLMAVVLGEVPRVRVHRVDIALIGFFLVTLLASLLVPYHFDSLRRLKEMLAGVVIFVVVKNLFADEQKQQWFIRVLMAMLGALAVIGVVHYLWYILKIRVNFLVPNIDPDVAAWEKDFGVRVTSLTGNPNFLAASLLVLVPMGLAWLVTHKRPRITLAPVVITLVWAVTMGVLLGVTDDWSQRFDQTRATVEKTPASSVEEVQNMIARGRAELATTEAWGTAVTVCTVLGVVWLWVMLCIWPFFGTAVAVVLGFASFLFTNSWAAYSGFIIVLVVLTLFILLKRPARFQPVSAAMLGGALAVMLVAFFGIKYATKSYIIPPREARTGLRSRELLWETAEEMAKARPVLGFGADNFFAFSNKYMSQLLPGPSRHGLILNAALFMPDPSRPPPSRITFFPQEHAAPGTASLLVEEGPLVMQKHAAVFVNNPGFIHRNPGRVHSEYLSVLVDTGFIGLAVFIAIFVFFYTGILGTWRQGEDSWRSVIFLGSGAAIAGILTMQTVDFPFRLPWASCFIVSALALTTVWQPGTEYRLGLKLPVPARVVAVVLVAAAGVYLTYAIVNQVGMQRAWSTLKKEEAQLGFPTNSIADKYRRLVDRGVPDHNVYFQLPEMLLWLGRLDAAADAIEKLEAIQPFHEKVQLYWGDARRKQGDLATAIEHYRRALELEPRYMKVRVLLIDTLIKANRLDEAKAAIAETWPWLEESKYRMELASGGSALVKRSEDIPSLYIEDLYWPWVMNANATVLALEGNFNAARRQWQETYANWRRDRGRLVDVEQGLYNLYAEVPIFRLNLDLLETTSPEAVRADPATWAKKFLGVAEYEAYKRLDDEYVANLYGRTRGRGGPPSTLSLDQQTLHAELLLEKIVGQFGEKILTLDGNLARDYHNRLGLLALRKNFFDTAANEFEQSVAGDGGDVARANLLAIRRMRPGYPLELPLIDEMKFQDIHRGLEKLQYHLSRGEIRLDDYVRGLRELTDAYPHYLPVATEMVNVLAATGNRAEARERLGQLRRWYPNNPNLEGFRLNLGL